MFLFFALVAAPRVFAGETPLRPLADFLAEPARSLVVMSPDGSRLAWQPWDAPGGGPGGTLVVALPDATESRQLPVDIGSAFLVGWAGPRALLCRTFADPDDWFLVGTETGARVDLPDVRSVTAGPGGRLFIAGAVPEGTMSAATALGLNVTNEPRPGVARLVHGADGVVAEVMRSESSPWDPSARQGPMRLLAVDGGTSRRVLRVAPSAPWWGRTGASVLSRAWGNAALVIDGNRTPLPVLEAVDLDRGAIRTIVAPARGVVVAVLQDPKTGGPLAVGIRDERLRWQVLDPSVDADVTRINAALPDDDWAPTSVSDDGTRWLLLTTGPQHSFRQYLYDRPTGTLSAIGGYADAFDALPWRPARALTFPARDGTPIGAYLTTPDPARYGPGPWPLVVQAHGGPWSGRDYYGWDFVAQRLAELGDAVLDVNFRGSGGYGAEFVEIGTLDGATDDIVDGVRAMVADGVTTADRVAMFGTSYGAIMVARAVDRDPDLLRCGVMNSGYGSAPAATPKTSLLMLNGLADTNVSPARAAAYAARLTTKGARPIVAVFPDGQHDLLAGREAEAAWSIAEAFLGHCLGGPSQPWANHLAGTRIELRAGADQLPGLAEALRVASGQAPSGLPSWLISEDHQMLPQPEVLRGE